MNFLYKYGPQLIRNGYSIIPIIERTKRPGCKLWQNLSATLDDLNDWLKISSFKGVGILTADTPAVDIDVEDPEIVEKMVLFCENNIGPSPKRIGKPPKTILVFQAKFPFKKIQSPKYKCSRGLTHQVEILGDGQQFVAFAVHPATKNDYIWPENSILHISQEQLSILTETQAREIIEYFKSIVPVDWEVVGKKKKPSKVTSESGCDLKNLKPPLNISIKEVKDNLSQLSSYDYDLWIRVGMALYHQFDGSPEGFNLWDEWSLESENYEDGKTEEKWPSFKTDLKTNPVTFATVLKLVKDDYKKINLDSRGLTLVHASEIEKKIGPIDWLVENYLESNTTGLLFGEPGSYKSFLSLDIALHIVTGKPWNKNLVKKGTVIYVAGEGHGGYAKRLKAWTQKHDKDLSKYSFFFTNRAVDLNDEKSVQELAKHIEVIAETEGPPVAIFIDTLARNFGPGDENSTTDMGNFINNVDRFLRVPYECGVIIVHHTGHSNRERARGSSALRAGIDFEYQVKKHKRSPLKAEMICTKMKDAEEPSDTWFQGENICVGSFDNEIVDSLIFIKIKAPEKNSPPLKGKQKELHKLWEEIGPVDMKEFRKSSIEHGIVRDSKDFSTIIYHLKKKGHDYIT
jgi:AAA domain-containing protein/primase-like protein/bifunctional DNA primase/polymerase-like protein